MLTVIVVYMVVLSAVLVAGIVWTWPMRGAK